MHLTPCSRKYDQVMEAELKYYESLKVQTEAPKEALSTWKTDPVVIDGNLISSRGPGTAAAFSYAILKELGYSEKAAALQQGMLFV